MAAAPYFPTFDVFSDSQSLMDFEISQFNSRGQCVLETQYKREKLWQKFKTSNWPLYKASLGKKKTIILRNQYLTLIDCRYREREGRSVTNDFSAEGNLSSLSTCVWHRNRIGMQTQFIRSHNSEEDIWEGYKNVLLFKKFSLNRVCAVKGLAGNCGRFCGDYLVKCPV